MFNIEAEPTSQDSKPRVQPGVQPPFTYITNVGGEPRVKPEVWLPEMWAQFSCLVDDVLVHVEVVVLLMDIVQVVVVLIVVVVV
jgi:hypothetical protein